MNKSRIQKVNMPICAGTLLLYMVIVTTQLLSGMYASYTNHGAAADNGRVAAFVFDIKDGADSQILNLSNIKKPGDSVTYEFVVTNSRAAKTSEVSQQYAIKFRELGSIPLTYTYQLKDSEPSEVYDVSAREEIKTITGELEAAAVSEITYIVKVNWDASKNDAKYSSGNGVASLKIDVTSEQID